MKVKLSNSLLLITIAGAALLSCKEKLQPEAVHEILLKELPSKTWLTSEFKLIVMGRYSAADQGVLESTGVYDNQSYYKVTPKGWPFIVNYNRTEGGTIEATTHYVTDFKINSVEMINASEALAEVSVIYALTEFAGDGPGKKDVDESNKKEIERCYLGVYSKLISMKMKKTADGWHVDNESKTEIIDQVQHLGITRFNPSLEAGAAEACLHFLSLQVRAYAIYDDNEVLAFDKAPSYSDKQYSQIKIVLEGNLKGASLSVVARGEDLVRKVFDLNGSAEFIFDAGCGGTEIDIRYNENRSRYFDILHVQCGAGFD
ncbi:hypothetical protein WSM22_36250 [Cytophagales bacterium WSM2-2]|nr:hypothetical protein WSM22_36250 [Cytophagales bacterium WSM2-2]